MYDSQPDQETQPIDIDGRSELRRRLGLVELRLSRLDKQAASSIDTTSSPSGNSQAETQTPAPASHVEEDAFRVLEGLAVGERRTFTRTGVQHRPCAIYDQKTDLWRSSPPSPADKLKRTGETSALLLPATSPNPAGSEPPTRDKSTIFVPEIAALPAKTHFMQSMSMGAQNRLILQALPSQVLSDTVCNYFITHCNWTMRSLHTPYFREEYNTFWQHINAGMSIDNLDPAWLALLFAIVSSAQ